MTNAQAAEWAQSPKKRMQACDSCRGELKITGLLFKVPDSFVEYQIRENYPFISRQLETAPAGVKLSS